MLLILCILSPQKQLFYLHHQYFIQKNNFYLPNMAMVGKLVFLMLLKNVKNRYLTYDVMIKLSSKQQRERAIKKAEKEHLNKITYQPV